MLAQTHTLPAVACLSGRFRISVVSDSFRCSEGKRGEGKGGEECLIQSSAG